MKSRRVTCNAVLALGTTQTLIRGLLAEKTSSNSAAIFFSRFF
jgi:hypothetical protein